MVCSSQWWITTRAWSVRVRAEQVEDDPRAAVFFGQVGRVKQHLLAAPDRQADQLGQNGDFVLRTLVQPDLADAQHVAAVEELGHHRDHLAGEGRRFRPLSSSYRSRRSAGCRGPPRASAPTRSIAGSSRRSRPHRCGRSPSRTPARPRPRNRPRPMPEGHRSCGKQCGCGDR